MKRHEASLCFFGAFCLIFFMAWTACKKSSPTSPSDSGLLTLSGTITQGGTPLSGVNVYLSWNASQTKTTGSDGKFSFSGLLKGNYFIIPSRVNTSFNPSNYEVGTASRSDLNFTAQAASFGSDVGAIAADFAAKDQKGANVSLYSNHGKVILMDFTADWCVPCRAKAETAEQFYQKYKDKGFMYILIVIEGNPSVWASTYGLTFPVLDDNSQTIYRIFQKATIPLPHILDRNMTIRYKKEEWNKAEVEDTLSKYL